jgi:hypothetical protein
MVRYHYARNIKATRRIIKHEQNKGKSATYRRVSSLSSREQKRAHGMKYEVRVTK